MWEGIWQQYADTSIIWEEIPRVIKRNCIQYTVQPWVLFHGMCDRRTIQTTSNIVHYSSHIRHRQSLRPDFLRCPLPSFIATKFFFPATFIYELKEQRKKKLTLYKGLFSHTTLQGSLNTQTGLYPMLVFKIKSGNPAVSLLVLLEKIKINNVFKMLMHTLDAFYRHLCFCVYHVQAMQAMMGIQPTDSSPKVLICATLVCTTL